MGALSGGRGRPSKTGFTHTPRRSELNGPGDVARQKTGRYNNNHPCNNIRAELDPQSYETSRGHPRLQCSGDFDLVVRDLTGQDKNLSLLDYALNLSPEPEPGPA